MEEISDNNKFSLSLDNKIDILTDLIEDLSILCAKRPSTELVDARTHLGMAIHLLKVVKHN